jgi:hypothetical protein
VVDDGSYVVEATVGDESLTVDTTEHVYGDGDCVRLRFERSPDGHVESTPTVNSHC